MQQAYFGIYHYAAAVNNEYVTLFLHKIEAMRDYINQYEKVARVCDGVVSKAFDEFMSNKDGKLIIK